MTSQLLLSQITQYVEEHIGSFHDKRMQTVLNLKLNQVLKRKNPYLFKAKYTQTAEELIRGILDAFISSQEETLFGNFLEGVAVFVGEIVYNGYKPTYAELTGIDLVLEKQDKVFVVEIKSGPHWGNSSQIKKMVMNFADAKVRLQPSYPNQEIVCINGCMYGQDNHPTKMGVINGQDGLAVQVPYLKLCGQAFWEFISGEENLYIDIIQPLGHQAKARNEAFQQEYTHLINRYTRDFLNGYCDENGQILWETLAQFVSGQNHR